MHKSKVRFAPSPTGPLHIGGARSALFNYIYAAHYGADMVLRIEDTDLDRSKREYEQEIITSLRWLGIHWSEGVDIGGENAPYRQTERLEIYEKYAQELIGSGKAYYCFCSEADLEAERQGLLESGEMPRYMGKCGHLDAEEVDARIKSGLKPTIRFRVPTHIIYIVDDKVRGRVNFESDNIGDFIIVKSDGIPTYNFAVVIDDVLMGITHIIRAEEHLSNTPRQLMIYDALNFKRPEFAHISLILGEDRQKMSKRHGATSLIEYREKGYLPQAMFNFLALLGWAPEGEKEILSSAEIIKEFTLDRVAKNPAVFDIDKLNWMNQQYLKKLSEPEFMDYIKPYLEKSKFADLIFNLSTEQQNMLILALRDRIVNMEQMETQLEVFFGDIIYEEEAEEILRGEGVTPVLEFFIQDLPDFNDISQLELSIKAMVKNMKLKPRHVFMPLRCALSGKVHGPDLPYLLYIWGQEETMRRLHKTLHMIKQS